MNDAAKDLAHRAHAGQTHKNGEPYFNHVERVMRQLDDPTAQTR